MVHASTGFCVVPCTVIFRAELPAPTVFGETEPMPGIGSPPVGEVRVSGKESEVPKEFDTVTAAVPGNAASDAGTKAVSCVALTKVVALFGSATPFQLTVASLVKFVPVIVSVKSWELQYGVEAPEVVEADRDVTVGGVPGVGSTVNRTIFEISVVVVL